MKLSELREAVKSGEYIAPPTLEEKKLLEDNSQFLSYQVAKHDAAEAKKQRKNLNAVAHIMATEAAGEKPKLEFASNIDPTKIIDRDWSAEPEGNKFVKMFTDNIEANGIRLSTPSMEKQWENNVTENAKALNDNEWKEYELKYRNALNEAKAKLGLESLPQEIANSFNEVIVNNSPQRNDNEYIRQEKLSNIHNYGLTLSAFRKSDFTSTSNKGKYTNSSKIEWDVLRTAHGIINGVEKPTGENHKYTLMNDDEKAVFNYYIGSGDYASAKKYLDTINSTLKSRLSQTVSKQWAQEGVKGDLKELGTAIVGGAETGIMDMTRSAIGIADAFGIKNGQESFSSLIAPTYQEQLASAVLAESKNSNHWFFNDVLLAVNSGIRQIPSMLISVSGGAFLGYLMQGVGSATTEAMRNNTNSAADVFYAVYEAAMEYATDLLLKGATAQLMGEGANLITKKLLSGVSKVVKNPKIAKMLSKGVILLGTGGSEWAEESIQALAEPAARAIIYNEKMDYNDETIKNALEAGFVGFLSGLMLGIPSVNSIYNQTQIELVGQNYIDSGNLAKLVKWAEDFGATDTPQYDNVKEAMLNNKPVDAGDVGGLLIHTNKTFNQFSPSDIAAFIKNTVKTSTPKDIADVMFNGNVEAAQKFIDKYSGMSVSEIAATAAQTPEAELPSVILGTAQNYDEVEAARKEIADNENKSRTEDIAKIKSAVQSRLVELGEKGNIEVLSSAITKVLAGEQLTKSEQRIISESRFGQRVLNEATAENVESGEYSSGWAEKIGTERINSRAYNLGVEGVDSAAVNGYNNTDENGRVGGKVNGSENAELLAGGKVSAVSGGGDSLREQSPNTAIIRGELGALSGNQGADVGILAAGTSGWISGSDRQPATKVGGGLDENFLRGVRGVALKDTDTIGRLLSPELKERLKDTVFKDEEGRILSFFHWTPNSFETFKYGDGAFHFGTLPTAISVKGQSDAKVQGNFKEVYINSKNPLVVYDNGSFSPSVISQQLVRYGLMSKEDVKTLSEMQGFYSNDINSEACQYMLEY
ncbi:MAG: hypothetical protein IKK13_01820, partial [Clostridia bacterium]|nr:hypothetical protein [Clostridia bacterium]